MNLLFHGKSIPHQVSVTTTVAVFQVSGGADLLKVTNEGPSDIIYSIGNLDVTATATGDGAIASNNILLLSGNTEYRLVPQKVNLSFAVVLAGAASAASNVQFELGTFIA